MKKYLLLFIFPLLIGTGFAMGRKAPEGVSLLLVPARPSLVQLGMDMAAQEHALLMTYAPNTPTDKLFLHIWDGNQWLPVQQSRFTSGTFVTNPVARLLVVGEGNELTASLIEKGLVWSPEVLHLDNGNVTELINQMGRVYGFKRKDWEWIAARYDLKLENLNKGRTQTSWYDENKASSLPPSDIPWKKPGTDGQVQPPETSLRPVMPPAAEPETTPAVDEEGVKSGGEDVNQDTAEPASEPSGDFNLEME